MNFVKKRKEIFLNRAKKLFKNKYDYSKVVYKNAHTDIIIICSIHGEFSISPNRHVSAKRECLSCIKEKRIKENKKGIIEKLKFIAKENGYEVIIHYVGENFSKTKYTWKCLKCGKIENCVHFRISKKKCSCKRKRNKKYTLDEVKKILIKKGFKLLSKTYKNANDHIKVECLKCNYKSNKKLGNILVGKGCAKCKGVKKYSITEVKEELKKRNAILLSNYISARKHIEVQCTICDYKWNVLFGAIIRRSNSGCHNCEKIRRLNEQSFFTTGRKEKNIVFPVLKKIFKKYQIIQQYPVQIENKKSFPYGVDFVIEELNLAIEFDEKHHESKKQKIKDEIRQNEIENKTNFIFLRLKENRINNIENDVYNFLSDNNIF